MNKHYWFIPDPYNGDFLMDCDWEKALSTLEIILKCQYARHTNKLYDGGYNMYSDCLVIKIELSNFDFEGKYKLEARLLELKK